MTLEQALTLLSTQNDITEIEINLSGCHPTELIALLGELSKQSQLQSLVLQGLPSCSGDKTTDQLDEYSREINQGFASFFKNHPTLRSFSFNHAKFSPESLLVLVEALSLNQSINSLDLSSNELGATHLPYLAALTQANPRIKLLNLSHNPLMTIDEADSIALASFLAHASNLEVLGLSHVCHGFYPSAGIPRLPEFMTQQVFEAFMNSSLISLDLSHNAWDPGSWNRMKFLVKNHTTLQALNLAHTQLNANFGVEIVREFAQNPVLQQLNLQANGLGTELHTSIPRGFYNELIYIEKARQPQIEKNEQLAAKRLQDLIDILSQIKRQKTINFGGNHFTFETEHAILACAQKNSNLHLLGLNQKKQSMPNDSIKGVFFRKKEVRERVIISTFNTTHEFNLEKIKLYVSQAIKEYLEHNPESDTYVSVSESSSSSSSSCSARFSFLSPQGKKGVKRAEKLSCDIYGAESMDRVRNCLQGLFINDKEGNWNEHSLKTILSKHLRQLLNMLEVPSSKEAGLECIAKLDERISISQFKRLQDQLSETEDNSQRRVDIS